MPVASQHTWGAFGAIRTDRSVYRPFENVTVTVTGRSEGDAKCTVVVADPDRREYLQFSIKLVNNTGSCTFTVGGRMGPHYLFLHFAGRKEHYRYTNFVVEETTSVQTGDKAIDGLVGFCRERMSLGRREYDPAGGGGGKFVGYISGDTLHFDGIWLRDSVHAGSGYQYWEPMMKETIDAFLDAQTENGMVADGIERDGRTWRVGMESDVEYILVLGAFRAWSCTGDDNWLGKVLPKLEKALAYITSDPKHWAAAQKLIKRQHSCDTWDYDIDGLGDSGNTRHVIANCDQSGYALAYLLMAKMYQRLGDEEKSDHWAKDARAYRGRAVSLLWDGTKFQHHKHLDAISHHGFDETAQLSMGNVWAVTRGLADPVQSRSIIDEYKSRQESTGDAFPWWSLQPGYPDELKYFAKRAYSCDGGYANGGLMPWVGGELCRASFMHGREKYGVELLRQYLGHLEKTGGSHVWYWPDGQAGHRTANEVNYTGWGMGEWVQALMGGLAGVDDPMGRMRHPVLSLRWLAAGIQTARVVCRYGASRAYVAYDFKHAAGSREASVMVTGSGDKATLRVLILEKPEEISARVDGKRVEPYLEREDHSVYLCLEVGLMAVSNVVLKW
jgi:hypothetical protein